MKLEKKFIAKINILKSKPDAKAIENLKKIHETLSDYLLRIDRIYFFYNTKRRKQIIDFYYARAIKILQVNLYKVRH